MPVINDDKLTIGYFMALMKKYSGRSASVLWQAFATFSEWRKTSYLFLNYN